MSTLLRIGFILVLAYLGLAAYMFICQKGFIFFPEKNIVYTPADAGLKEYEDVEIVTEDGIKIHGWYIPHPKPLAYMIFFHGNAGNISDRIWSIDVFNQMGLSVFIFDYRGYGKSEGDPSEDGLYKDALAAWHYMTETRRISPDNIVLFGRSLGGGVASWLARGKKPGAVICESTFSSIGDMGQDTYPYLPVRYLVRYRFSAIDHIRDVACPVLIIHSPDDDIVPFAHGKRIFEAANEPKDFLEIKGSHNEGMMLSEGIYRQGVRDFIQKYFTPNDDLSARQGFYIKNVNFADEH